MTTKEACEVLRKRPMEDLARWYVSLNRFEWPDDLPFERPEPWPPDRAARHQGTAGAIWEAVKLLLPPREQSRAWWRARDLGTEQQWEAWYRAEHEAGH